MAKRKSTQRRKQNSGESHDSQQKSNKSSRRPPRRWSSDGEILDHHWEVVDDDSPAARRKAQVKKRPRKQAVEEKSAIKAENKHPEKESTTKPEHPEKKVVRKKRQRRVKKKPVATEQASVKAAAQDQKTADTAGKADSQNQKTLAARENTNKKKKTAAKKPKASGQKPESGQPSAETPEVQTSKTEKAKKKHPPRRRRKSVKRPAEAAQESAAERAAESQANIPEGRDVIESQPPSEAESSFWDMPLSPATQKALRAADYLQPTPVQAGLIPKAIMGHDLMGQARTGTGKTAAFAIPILEQIDITKKQRGPQALVLVPTRELAVQVRDECAKLAMHSKARIVAVYGGKPIRGQMEKLSRGAEIVVGTPGRVMDHMSRGTLFLGDLRIAVLDEADRMLDIGFRPDIEKILRRCPQSRQTLLLSATIPPPVKRLAERYMRDAEMLDFSPEDVSVDTIDQYYFTVDAARKFDLLVKLLQREEPRQSIIFCRTRRGTERIYQRLAKKEPGAACIHGDLPQSTRDRVMRDFRAGKVRLLLATDVVGRGIDVSGVSHIINFDTPEFCDDYVHRVGRTGRMGREGVAYSFVTPEEGNELTRIEMRINRLLQRDEIKGFAAEPKPIESMQTEKPETKPVFGRRERRIRRAL